MMYPEAEEIEQIYDFYYYNTKDSQTIEDSQNQKFGLIFVLFLTKYNDE